MRVLEALAQSPGAMSVKELSQATQLAPSKLHRYLVSWTRTGMLTQFQGNGRYDFGEAARRMGLLALGRLDEFAITSDHLLRLRDETGLTAALVIWGSDGPRAVRWEPGLRPLMLNLRVGMTIPLGSSATALIFLAWLPDAMTRPVLEAQRRVLGSEELGPEISRAELDKIRSQRSVLTQSALILGIDALAAPVFGPHGGLSSVIVLLGSHDLMQGATGRKARAAIEAAAAEITRELGAKGAGPLGPLR